MNGASPIAPLATACDELVPTLRRLDALGCVPTDETSRAALVMALLRLREDGYRDGLRVVVQDLRAPAGLVVLVPRQRAAEMQHG